MITRKSTMHSKVLELLLELIQEEHLPIHMDIGERYKDQYGSMQTNVYYEYEYKDHEAIEKAICRATNLTFDLMDE